MKITPKYFNQANAGYSDLAAIGAERNANGLPVAWKLFDAGDVELTRGGEVQVMHTDSADLSAMMNYFQEKGVKIPIDSEHVLKYLADHYEVEESELANRIPGGYGTLGFANLERRGDSIWLSDVEFVDAIKPLVKAGVWRYFSPVFRGMSDNRPRVTSVAMTNEPSINNLDSLAASADEPADIEKLNLVYDSLALGSETDSNHQPKMEAPVNKLQQALTGLLGDSIALGADGDAPDSVINKINQLASDLPNLKASGGLTQKVRDSLSLSAEAGESEIIGALTGLVAKGQGYDNLKEQVDSLALAAEEGKLQKLIDGGLDSGKLTNDQVDNWIRPKKVDSATLSAYLEHAPVVVPKGRIDRHDFKPEADSISLTAEDREVCKMSGISEEEFLKAKKGE